MFTSTVSIKTITAKQISKAINIYLDTVIFDWVLFDSANYFEGLTIEVTVEYLEAEKRPAYKRKRENCFL